MGAQTKASRATGRSRSDSRSRSTPLSSRTPGPPATRSCSIVPGSGQSLRRIFGRDARLDRRTAALGRLGGNALAGGDSQHLLHQIDPGHELGDRVLDLQARVHLEKVEVAAAIQQKLEGSGRVSSRWRARPSARPRRAPRARRRQHGARRLFDDLLVAALQRAVAFDKVNHRPSRSPRT